MIDHEWHRELGDDDTRAVRQMLTESAAADAEAGFSGPSLDRRSVPGTSHLLVRLRSWGPGSGGPGPGALAAYLRLDPDPQGPATVSYVVRPELRSLGISTLLVERLGLDLGTAGGWSVWACGDHPAAERMARRFGVGVTRRQWRLLAPPRSDPPGGVVTADPDDPGDAALVRNCRLRGFVHDRTDVQYTVKHSHKEDEHGHVGRIGSGLVGADQG